MKIVSTLYHGTKNPNLKPVFGGGMSNTDFGSGFYTTPVKDLGKEWAWSTFTKGTSGYVYEYTIDTQGLNIIDLRSSIYNWVAEVIYNRGTNIAGNIGISNTIPIFLKKYKLNTSNADILIGFRADDSYFNYIQNFVNNTISIETLEQCMHLGNLGIQVMIKSRRAFSRLVLVKKERVPRVPYEKKASTRTGNAIQKYKTMYSTDSGTGTYFIDIIRAINKGGTLNVK